MATILVETSVVDTFGNAYIDGSNNAYILLVPTITAPLPQAFIPGAEWQIMDHLMEPNRLKTRW